MHTGSKQPPISTPPDWAPNTAWCCRGTAYTGGRSWGLVRELYLFVNITVWPKGKKEARRAAHRALPPAAPWRVPAASLLARGKTAHTGGAGPLAGLILPLTPARAAVQNDCAVGFVTAWSSPGQSWGPPYHLLKNIVAPTAEGTSWLG